MVALLRFRAVTRTVRLDLPGGSSRTVKVTTNDARDIQQVEDDDVLHGHVIPAPFGIGVRQPVKQRRPLLLRNLGMPKMRQRFEHDRSTDLWKPDVVWTARQIRAKFVKEDARERPETSRDDRVRGDARGRQPRYALPDVHAGVRTG